MTSSRLSRGTLCQLLCLCGYNVFVSKPTGVLRRPGKILHSPHRIALVARPTAITTWVRIEPVVRHTKIRTLPLESSRLAALVFLKQELRQEQIASWAP